MIQSKKGAKELLQHVLKLILLQVQTNDESRERWEKLLEAHNPPEEVKSATLDKQVLWMFQNRDKQTMNDLREQLLRSEEKNDADDE